MTLIFYGGVSLMLVMDSNNLSIIRWLPDYSGWVWGFCHAGATRCTNGLTSQCQILPSLVKGVGSESEKCSFRIWTPRHYGPAIACQVEAK